jgi:hypothetical protein
MYCRELFEHCALLRISSGVLSWPSPFTLRSTTESSSNSSTPNFTPSHLVHSKHFINSFVSHTSTHLHTQPLSFDRLPFFAGGGVGYQTGYPPAAISAFCPPVSPLATSLTDTPPRKSFGNHSYVKRRGVGVYLQIKGRSQSPIPVSRHIAFNAGRLTLPGLRPECSAPRGAHSRLAHQFSLLRHFLVCSGNAMLPRAGHSRTCSEDRSTASGPCSWTHTSEGASE